MENLIERFSAVDADGNSYSIECYQEIIESKNMSGEINRINGLKRFESEYRAVNMISKNEFIIVSLNKKVNRIN